MPFTARFVGSVGDVTSAAWNTLALHGSPFVRHEFLLALEQCGCVGPHTGWTPHFLLAEDEQGRLAGAMPLYLKSHSWGEFVFDWSWARAYAQAGLDYYPKLTSMAPFTPATSPRLLTRMDVAEPVRKFLVERLLDYATEQSLSSAHALFVPEAERASFAAPQWLWRKDCQFHWHNRDYRTFDDFIASFRAEKRKKALRERRRIGESGIHFLTLAGHEIDDALWDVIYEFSAATFAAHGHTHYLNAAFFKAVARAIPEAVMVKLAVYRSEPVAAAIFFRSDDTLYGRYWGAAGDFHSLHFETCYYQGIDYCIEHGLQHFEPGTQGEHKVARGFEPTATWSAHWIADPRFCRAIHEYLEQERAGIDGYMASVRDHIPFRRDLPAE